MNPVAEDILMHYGVKRRSGRYPWGSGDNPYQHSGDFLSRVKELEAKGFSEKELAKEMGFDSTTDFRLARSVARNERRKLQVERAKALKEDGLNVSEIGREMGVNESTVRSWLNPNAEANMTRAQNTAEVLRKELEEKGMLDVGAGVERELGVSPGKLNEALAILENEGYNVYGVGIPQVDNPGKQTNTKVLAKKDIQYKDVYANMGDIQSVKDYHSIDGGANFTKLEYPASIKSSRVKIRYAEDGGTDMDGVIEIRRGVKDLDLGNSHYAQVRILVDGTNYLKGMAIYSDDIPDGADIVFNTNKKKGTPKMGENGVLKPIKSDPDNPFGALIKANGQYHYKDSRGRDKLGAINKLKEEGDWDTMSRNLSQQFLSKQPMAMIKKQLRLTYDDYADEYNEIMSLSNPTVRKNRLMEFANKCDSATVHLKAAALPRQQTRVILPVKQLKDNEVYAPYLKNGEKVALVRYPHGGTFEIPTLTVNNKNSSAKKLLGNAVDAIGINSKVAERLSGADFDGDTVIVIPTNSRVRVKSTPPLEGLKGFDPKSQYSTEGKTGVKIMTKAQTQREMGIVSNLITDMTLRGAPESDIVKAVKHSMVVIDANKHKLDYKQSEIDNDIATLKKLWQPKYDSEGNVVGSGGASTLLSRRKQTVDVPERRGSGRIDPTTGEVVYKESGRTYTNAKGETVRATTKVPLMTYVKDVRSVSSGTPQEDAYADYANKMRALANDARKEYATTPRLKKSSTAAQTYKKEVDSLMSKLNIAAKNAPRERRAQALANSIIKAKVQDNPSLAEKENKKDYQKVKTQALTEARQSVGASGRQTRIHITDKEWEAIQAGAISDTTLGKILRYSDSDEINALALPRTTTTMSTAKIQKLRSMKASGYTIAEMADSLGVSTSTVSKYLNS